MVTYVPSLRNKVRSHPVFIYSFLINSVIWGESRMDSERKPHRSTLTPWEIKYHKEKSKAKATTERT